MHTFDFIELDLKEIFTEFRGQMRDNFISCHIYHSIKPGIKFFSRPGSETIWIKLDCDFFDLLSDIYCCFVYAAPSNSPYLRRLEIDAFENLATEISEFVGQGSLCLLGDFNSRTGDGLDFLPEEDNSSIPATQSGLYQTVCIGNIYTRINLDNKNQYLWEKITQLCHPI